MTRTVHPIILLKPGDKKVYKLKIPMRLSPIGIIYQ
jgi:hypothetical protein